MHALASPFFFFYFFAALLPGLATALRRTLNPTTMASSTLTPSAPQPRVNVAVDVDEVLAQFVPALATFHNERYPLATGAPLTAASFVSYEFHRVWGGTAADCSMKMEAFFESPHFAAIRPVPGALEALQSLVAEFPSLKLHVVTARQNRLQEQTRAWLDEHYPNIFDHECVHFGNHYTSDGSKSRSKPDMCRAVDAICLIDDSQIYANQCAAVGMPVVLFGDYAWNSDSALQALADQTGKVQRVSDWTEARRQLRDKILAAMASDYSSSATFMPTSARLLASAIKPLSVAQTGGDAHPLVAVIQLCSGTDKDSNLAKIDELVQAACMVGAKLVCLPEASLFLGAADAEQAVAQAEPMEGKYFTELCSLARKYQLWLSFCTGVCDDGGNSGSGGDGRLRNRHVLVDVMGHVTAQYDKLHLFDSPFSGLHESKSTAAGEKLVVHHDNPFGSIGLSICYDLRFPGLFSRLCRPAEAGGLGAQILLVPSAFTVPTGEAHWEVLLRARAIENQAWVIASAQCGEHAPTRKSYGNSLVVDPWGNVVVRCDSTSEGFALFSLDLGLVSDTRTKMPVLSHSRHDLY